jgi:ADP-ribose pyrophosphatase YjhB (NUDIX family)
MPDPGTVVLRQAIVAIIEDGDEMLFIERGLADTYGGYWSNVTGEMNAGESQADACVREAFEEVGLKVKPERKLWESVTRGAHFVLHWWLCRLDGPRIVKPQPGEVENFRWGKLADVEQITPMFSDTRLFYRDVYPLVR